MLPKSYRLPRESFDHVFHSGKRIQTKEFQYIVITSNNPHSRFAIVVGKKIAKLATHRNRMKRLINESLHHLLPTFSQSYDGIFFVKFDFSTLPQNKVESLVSKIVQST